MPNIITTENARFASNQIGAALNADRRGMGRAFRRFCEYFLFANPGETVGEIRLRLDPNTMYVDAEILKRSNLSLGMAAALMHLEEELLGNWYEYSRVTKLTLVPIDGWAVMVPNIRVQVTPAIIESVSSKVHFMKYMDNLVFWLRTAPLNQIVWEELTDPTSDAYDLVRTKIIQFTEAGNWHAILQQ